MCEHDWVYDEKVILTDPPMIKRICKNCGVEETVAVGSKEKESFKSIQEKFRKGIILKE